MMDCVTQSAASQVSKNDFLSHQLKHSLPSDGSPDLNTHSLQNCMSLNYLVGVVISPYPFYRNNNSS